MKKTTCYVAVGFLLLLVLSGCASQGMSLTLAADHHAQGTKFYDVQMTASVQAGRFQSTQDFYTTQVAVAATQNQFLKSTLEARGTPREVIDAYQQQIESGGQIFPTRTPLATPTFAPLIPPTPLSGAPTSDAGSGSTSAKGGGVATNPDAALNAVPPTSGPRLTDLMAAPGVGNDDCAQNATTTFATSTPEIYIVATAHEITSGMTLASQWDISGQQRTYEFAPDFDIDGACIWFYIDQSEFAFQPGTATISLSVNGASMGSVIITLQ